MRVSISYRSALCQTESLGRGACLIPLNGWAGRWTLGVSSSQHHLQDPPVEGNLPLGRSKLQKMTPPWVGSADSQERPPHDLPCPLYWPLSSFPLEWFWAFFLPLALPSTPPLPSSSPEIAGRGQNKGVVGRRELLGVLTWPAWGDLIALKRAAAGPSYLLYLYQSSSDPQKPC